MKEEEKRADAPREGATRWTIIVEKQYVNYLKNYSKRHKVQITELIGDALGNWIERLKSGRERY